MSGYAGCVALVTGGGSGIGAALVEALVRGGAARVWVADVDRGAAEAVAARCGEAAVAVSLDVRDAVAVAALVEEIEAREGALGLLINNAGVGLTGEVRDLELAHWERVMGVNLWGVIHGVQAVYPRMAARGRGQIVNVASVAGLSPAAFSAAYAASKHAVVGLSTSLRAEAAGLGVRVSVACPGLIETPLIRQGPSVGIDAGEAFKVLGVPAIPASVCAARILEGAARDEAIIVVTWQARVAWWLWRLWPGLSLWLSVDLARKLRALRRA
jgi:NAD(P)-dependent dehydrogenase (short-subunit alcohol dehydrogenase family)